MLSQNLQLSGRVAVVTGGSRGIGRAVVERLAEMGSHVVVNYITDRAAADDAVASAQQRGVDAIAVQANVARLADADHLIQTAKDRFGRVDALICNAGIWKGAPVDEMSDEIWNQTMDINLKGTWTVCRAAVPIMKQQRFGRIVIVSSTAGQRGEAGYSNYAASKAGQIAFTKSLASELGTFGINVNAVAPGWVDTEMTAEDLGGEASRESIAKTIPIGKIASADDIACPIVFLCSDWARHITGEVLNVNGGSVLCG
ncbi:MAG: 3-oxoacyl-ACP reductase family protein [Acidobacteriota bacterium]